MTAVAYADPFEKYIKTTGVDPEKVGEETVLTDEDRKTVENVVAPSAGVVATEAFIDEESANVVLPKRSMFGASREEVLAELAESRKVAEAVRETERRLVAKYESYSLAVGNKAEVDKEIEEIRTKTELDTAMIDNFLIAQGTDPTDDKIANISLQAKEYEPLINEGIVDVDLEDLEIFSEAQKTISELSQTTINNENCQNRLELSQKRAVTFATIFRELLIEKRQKIQGDATNNLLVLEEKKAEFEKEIETIMSDAFFREYLETKEAQKIESNNKKGIQEMRNSQARASKTLTIALNTVAKKAGIEFSDDDPRVEDESGLPLSLVRLRKIKKNDRSRFNILVEELRNNLANEVNRGKLKLENIRPSGLSKDIAIMANVLRDQREYIKSKNDLKDLAQSARLLVERYNLLTSIIGIPNRDAGKETNPLWLAISQQGK